MDVSCREIAKMIDHSLLRPDLTEADIRAGCTATAAVMEECRHRHGG